MKNLLKISLACLCLLLSVNALKAQCTSNAFMTVLSQEKTPTHVLTKIKVYAGTTMSAIEVGDKVCYNASTCTGTFKSVRKDYTYFKTLPCFLEQAGCSVVNEGCVVVIAGKNGGS